MPAFVKIEMPMHRHLGQPILFYISLVVGGGCKTNFNVMLQGKFFLFLNFALALSSTIIDTVLLNKILTKKMSVTFR